MAFKVPTKPPPTTATVAFDIVNERECYSRRGGRKKKRRKKKKLKEKK